MRSALPLVPLVLLVLSVLSAAITLNNASFAAEDDNVVIGVRRETPLKTTAVIGAPKSAPAHDWFKAGQSETAFHIDALSAARALVTMKESASEFDDLKQAVVREKDRCVKEFLWMLNWKNCPDPLTRRGAIAGLTLCNPEPKVAGKTLAISAVYEPDPETRKATIELIKARKDPVAARGLIDVWKSAFDEAGVLADNQPTRKAAVDTMRAVGDKRVFQAILWYAMLELRAGTAAPAGIGQVSIKGQGINLPIDLPILDLVSVQGNIIIPAQASLRQATGQDFGHNFDKWKEWINGLP